MLNIPMVEIRICQILDHNVNRQMTYFLRQALDSKKLGSEIF
jgi:hypothetical protein